MLVPAPSYRWQWRTTTVQHLCLTRQRSASRLGCCGWHFSGALQSFLQCYGSIVSGFKFMFSAGQLKTLSRLVTVHFGWFCGSGCEYTFGFSGLGQEQLTRSLIATAHFSEQTVCFQLLLLCAVISCKWVLRLSVCKRVV